METIIQFLPDVIKGDVKNSKIEYQNTMLKRDYIIDIIHTSIQRYNISEKNIITLNALILKKKYGSHYNKYISFITEKGYISLINDYSTGKTSRTYRLTDKILKSDYKIYENNDKVLLKKNVMDYTKPTKSEELNKLIIEDLSKVEINYEFALDFLNRTKNLMTKESYHKNLLAVESIAKGSIYCVGDDYGRIHTNFTNLKSYIRKNYLSINGDKLIEFDIKNSQPYLLTRIIHENNNNTINPIELEYFIELTKKGLYYEYFQSKVKGSKRKDIKEMTYKVLFGRNNIKKECDQLFYKSFPTIYNFIVRYKEQNGNYKALSHQLQRIESKIIFEGVIRKIKQYYPHISVITIHDSVMVEKKYRNEVSRIFNSEINKI